MGDFARARSWLDEADALFEELGDGHGSADAIGARCDVEIRTGNYDKAVELAERLAVARRSLSTTPTQRLPQRGLEPRRKPSRRSPGRFWDELSRRTTGRLQNVAG